MSGASAAPVPSRSGPKTTTAGRYQLLQGEFRDVSNLASTNLSKTEWAQATISKMVVLLRNCKIGKIRHDQVASTTASDARRQKTDRRRLAGGVALAPSNARVAQQQQAQQDAAQFDQRQLQVLQGSSPIAPPDWPLRAAQDSTEGLVTNPSVALVGGNPNAANRSRCKRKRGNGRGRGSTGGAVTQRTRCPGGRGRVL